VTSPWDAYGLRFIPSIYGMSARVNTGQDLTQAPWGGPYWVSLVTSGVGYLTFVLFLIGAGGLVRLAMGRKASPLHFVLGWVGLFGGYLLIRVNMMAAQYILPVAPAIAIIAACGFASVRKKLASIAPPAPAMAGVVVIAALALSCQVLQNRQLLSNLRGGSLRTELLPVQQVIGQWYSRCVPPDARVFPAPYTYIPPEITAVWFRSQGYEALRQFRPNLVMVRTYEEKFYLQAPELTSPTVMETGDDAMKFYKIVLRSDEYVAGPQFDIYRAYLTPDLAKVVAGRGPDCLHP
jgi:4-amino-4-deoxy-L-arabinose transferase-like glycosyltransferase